MNAAEIEDEISKLAAAPFDAQNFPYQFLQAFGVNDTAVAKLKAGRDNKSDIPGGVLQRAKNNIHLKTCAPGLVADTLADLRNSEATKKLKAKYILATDGQTIAAERLRDGETLACDYKNFPNRFGILLELAGISTTRPIEESTFDIRATSKLNKLYVELLRHNPDWGTDARRQDLNHFFARLIFCFFAEDTGIFNEPQLFTSTVEKWTDRTGSNVHEILADLFRAMNIRREDRATADLRPVALNFPYVNGNLFGDNTDTPRFTQAARIYLLAVGSLDWKQVNPDIFGSMIQAVADDEERGALGMHYTSVPNILKVLNPLFLDDLRQKLQEAGDGSTPASKGQLKRLRDRLARIRVFDPACGSGNFLVIAYKEMRKIEAIINQRRGERDLPSVIPSTNFRGIEIRHFAAEIARLALIIAKFQCDALHIGSLFACRHVLPLDKENWITCGNALRLDWLQICPPTGTGVKIENSDGRLFAEKPDQPEIDFENVGGETYICGNPPYLGSTWQSDDQKEEIESIFYGRLKSAASLDYVSGWFMKAADYGAKTKSAAAFVSTNSVCQGQVVPLLWPLIFRTGHEISFAHTSFKWKNLASHNAGVTVAIVGISGHNKETKKLYSTGVDGETEVKFAQHINAYLVNGPNVIVEKLSAHRDERGNMDAGGKPVEGGYLLLDSNARDEVARTAPGALAFLKRVYGANEYVKGQVRHCFWIPDEESQYAAAIPEVSKRLLSVASFRAKSPKAATNRAAQWPHRFDEVKQRGDEVITIVPVLTAEVREYIPAGLLPPGTIVTNLAFAIYDAPLWNLALIVSKLHFVWIATICGKFKTDYRYSNTLGWNTFPVPTLTDQNKSALTRCAEEILLAREAHFPATIAELYDPEKMPADLRAAHDRNDETLERIYIGRRFKNDTERLEKLFAMYTEMTGGNGKRK
jgi:hypothetical protein